MHKAKKIVDTTTNPTEYKKVYKKLIAKKVGKCPMCPWHSKENYGHRDDKNWKRYRKKQFKVKGH